MGWWTPGQPVPTRIVFLEPKHRDKLRYELIDVAPPWPRVLEISPEISEQLPIVEALCDAAAFEAALKPDRPDWEALHALVERCDPAVRDLLQLIVQLLVAFRRSDMQMAAFHAKRLSAVMDATPIVSAQSSGWVKKVLQFLEHLAKTCLSEFGLPAIYRHGTPDAAYKSWWHIQPSFHNVCQMSLQKFEAVLGFGPPASYLALKQWLSTLQKQVADFKSPGTGDPEVARFRVASAFFTALSDSWFAREHAVLGMIALHRAAEWLLVAMCASQQLLDFSNRSKVEVLTSAGWKPLSFDTALDALVANGASLSNLVGPLQSLNAWRNLCGYTHHLSAPETAVALPLCADIRDRLHKLADASWSKAVEVYKTPLPLNLTMLLDPNGTLKEHIAELTQQDLSIE